MLLKFWYSQQQGVKMSEWSVTNGSGPAVMTLCGHCGDYTGCLFEASFKFQVSSLRCKVRPSMQLALPPALRENMRPLYL